MLRMASSRSSTCQSWETVQTRVSIKQEGDMSPRSGSVTSSPPLGSPRTGRSPNPQETTPCHPEADVGHRVGLRRPELTFSIERILGLSSSPHSVNPQPVVAAAVPDRRMFASVVGGNIGPIHGRGRNTCRNRSHEENDDDDMDDDDLDEEDDDEGEDNESVIDVGGPGESTQFLSQAGHEFPGELSCMSNDGVPNYQWLHCTRYHPPKLQRSKKAAGAKKRKLGRNPRVPFTQHQVMVLEEKFRRTHYLSSMDVAELSTALSLTETRVKIWFQNRRARERRDKEAQQRNQHSGVSPKPFQPLTIPTVTWSVPSQPMTSSNYAQFPGNSAHQDFPPSGYLSSPFSMFAGQVSAVRKVAVDLTEFGKETPRSLLFTDRPTRGRPSLGDARSSSEEST